MPPDDAEEWLQDHDPHYARRQESWKHVRTGRYRIPDSEIPWGSSQDLAELVEHGGGQYVDEADGLSCLRCRGPFVPKTRWQRYCTNTCRQQAHYWRSRT